jgi:hypothetical protein
MAADLTALIKGFSKQQVAVGGLSRAWDAIVPASLAKLTSAHSISPGGVLVVRAADSSAAFEFDQWLRGQGGEAAIAAASTRAIRRVRVVVGALDTKPKAPADKPRKATSKAPTTRASVPRKRRPPTGT